MDQYLGDGLFASFDGFQIRLWTDRGGEVHEVFIEPKVWMALLQFVEELRSESQNKEPARRDLTDH